ncbi:MAG: dTDP-4-dehydrorhamnose reductase [Lachnospiraceae bacterium]|uniref:dTDP-4-dehydrorhamnose reductase n=1 Tax=Candidatus Weimeria bifida TaxID=2599074 RepID=A0A6N7J056_9FIRM|nr:dTDP-4-dehydrorhamnose reductase [Candidatus Weimeria bifida]RRF96439.1 MAG: dTDP-4-dehydrorhamnose reductase [Lachnospiraceae bacterium]
MRKIVVTGPNGQLGKAVLKEYKNDADAELISISHREMPIEDLDAVLNKTAELDPDVIINCAGYTDVDGCEKNTHLAGRINGIGPRNLAIAAQKTGAKLVHISTDYVFDGCGDRPYVESDAPGPVSAYGRSKLVGEKYVESLCQKYFIIRTAWLYGDGENFVRSMLRLSESHDQVSVVDDQIGCPTSAAEVAKLIHYLEQTEQYGLYHGVCRGETSWADFAERIFSIKGIKAKVNHISSEEYVKMNPDSANRPHYSVLEDQMLSLIAPEDGGFQMATWQEAIKNYLKK